MKKLPEILPASGRCMAAVFLVAMVWSAWGCGTPEAGNGAAVGGTPVAAKDGAWIAVQPGYPWSFPADHWSHPGYKTEWWYWTGHLESDDVPRRRFGYQMTFFRIGMLPQRPALDSAWAVSDLVMAHLALTDLDGGTHRFREVLYRATPLLGGFPSHPDAVIAWTRPPASSPRLWRLLWNGEGFDLEAGDDDDVSLRFETRPLRPMVFQGPGGYSRKGEGPTAASLYYSFTRLATRGTVTLDGASFEVHGTSWMDREIGSDQLADHQVGWDWLGLQLGDGRDLMVYRLRDRDGKTDFRSATLVDAQSRALYLKDEDWSLEATSTWKSPATGAAYPSGWRLRIPAHDLDLQVVPRLDDQENRGRIFYWEGAVAVSDSAGNPAGQGYAELTGYGNSNRPAL